MKSAWPARLQYRMVSWTVATALALALAAGWGLPGSAQEGLPPTLQAIGFEASEVAAGGVATVRLSASEAASGMRGGTVTLAGPSGQQLVAPLDRGASWSDWLARLSLAPSTQAGKWNIRQVVLVDNDGESVTLTAGKEFQSPGSLTVTAGQGEADVSRPVIRSVAVSAWPGGGNVVQQGAAFALQVEAADGGSGIKSATAQLALRGDRSDQAITIRLSLDAATGRWRGLGRAPLAVPNGANTLALDVVYLEVTDAAGNVAVKMDELPSIGVVPRTLVRFAGLSDQIGLFVATPTRFDLWLAEDAQRQIERLRGIPRSLPPSQAGLAVLRAQLNAELRSLRAELDRVRAEIYTSPTRGFRLAAPATSGKLIALAKAVSGRLLLMMEIDRLEKRLERPALAVTELSQAMDITRGPGETFRPVDPARLAAVGPAAAETLAEGLEAANLPVRWVTSGHRGFADDEQDFLDDRVIWLLPFDLSVAGYHLSGSREISIAFDAWMTGYGTSDLVSTALHELGHHVMDAALGPAGQRDGEAERLWQEYLGLRRLEGAPDGHDAQPPEVAAEDLVWRFLGQAERDQWRSRTPGLPVALQPELESSLAALFDRWMARPPVAALALDLNDELRLVENERLTVSGVWIAGRTLNVWLLPPDPGELTTGAATYTGGPPTTVQTDPSGRFQLELTLPAGLSFIVVDGLGPDGEPEARQSFYALVTPPEQGQPGIISLAQPVPEETNAPDLVLDGSAPGAARIEVNGVPTASDAAGRFRVRIPLRLGDNRVTIVAWDSAGRMSRLELPVRLIATVPNRTLAPVATIEIDRLAAGTTVSWPGGSATVSDAGRLSIVQPLNLGPNTVAVEIRSPSGTRTTRTYAVERLAAVEGPNPARLVLNLSPPAEVNGEQLLLQGQATPGAVITAERPAAADGSNPVLASATADDSGAFSLAVPLSADRTALLVVAKDSGGNVRRMETSVRRRSDIPTRTDQPSVTITWTGLLPGTEIRLAEVTAVAGEDGSASIQLPLAFGLNRLRAEIRPPLGAGWYGLYSLERTGGPTVRTILMRLNARRVQVDGGEMLAPVAPRQVGDLTFVPVRFIGEAFGGTVDWDGVNRRATYRRAGREVILTVGSPDAWVNGRLVRAPAAPRLVNGSTLVPLRFLGEALGATVQYRSSDRSILIFFFE